MSHYRFDRTTHKLHQCGVTLLELIVFIVVVSVGFSALLLVFNQTMSQSVDPIIRMRLVELAQSQLDEIVARKYDENTPIGGVPACDTAEGAACAGMGLEAGEDINDANTLDDVDDFNGYSDTPYTTYTRTVAVVLAGDELGINIANAKRITVTVSTASGENIQLSSYRTNF